MQFVLYSMSHLYCYRKKHKYFGLIHVREGRRSVVNSFKEAVVVSLSLHHQQCDNFHKIQKENAKWVDWSCHFICCAALPLFPLGLPVKACTTLLWGPGSHVHCEVDGVWTCWPGPLWNISLSSEAFEENDLLDELLVDVGWSGCRCDTPGSSSKPPLSSELLSLGAPAS
jgi:hypothetical protein